jgi:C_GCAxxG_C_C family probable redox protein
MSPESVGKRASELFQTGLNCAESVLVANMETLGVEGDWLPRIATGFGSGIATTQQVCGAISGAVMVAGWVLGRDSGKEGNKRLYQVCDAFINEFRQEFSSSTCRDLIGVDLSDPAERKRARDTGVFVDKCVPLVEFSARRIAEALSGESS